jgi:ferrous iron transport protein B
MIDAMGAVLGPAMSLFNLPADAALTVVLASIRKDGIALLTADGASTARLPKSRRSLKDSRCSPQKRV